MKFSEDKPEDGFFIQSYDEQRVIIRDRGFDSSLIICPDRVIEDWQPQHVDALALEHFDAVLQLEPELVLLGTGNRLSFPAVEVYASLLRRNIGVEVMDTGAACRTYNILMGEGRRVVAGLIIASA